MTKKLWAEPVPCFTINTIGCTVCNKIFQYSVLFTVFPTTVSADISCRQYRYYKSYSQMPFLMSTLTQAWDQDKGVPWDSRFCKPPWSTGTFLETLLIEVPIEMVIQQERKGLHKFCLMPHLHNMSYIFWYTVEFVFKILMMSPPPSKGNYLYHLNIIIYENPK